MNIFKRSVKYNQTCEEVLELYSDTVYKVALSTMKNEADAQDIFQEVFLRFVKNKPEFESDEHGKAWFIRVTLNCCNSMHTHKSRKENVPLVVDIADEKVHDTGIRYYVNELDEVYRIVIHLFYYEQYSVKDIAKLLKQNESAIKTRLYRARAILKERWEEENNA